MTQIFIRAFTSSVSVFMSLLFLWNIVGLSVARASDIPCSVVACPKFAVSTWITPDLRGQSDNELVSLSATLESEKSCCLSCLMNGGDSGGCGSRDPPKQQQPCVIEDRHPNQPLTDVDIAELSITIANTEYNLKRVELEKLSRKETDPTIYNDTHNELVVMKLKETPLAAVLTLQQQLTTFPCPTNACGELNRNVVLNELTKAQTEIDTIEVQFKQ
jgi:hypothetical protein